MNIPSILVTVLLGLEAVAFFVLTLPHNSTARAGVINLVERSPVAKKVWHFWRISLIFVTLLFADAVRGIVTKKEHKTELEPNEKLALSKLMAQRNVYLCGSCLALAYAIWRVEALLRELQVKTDPSTVKKVE